MSYLVFDIESTILNKGDPFNPNNRMCYIGADDGNIYNDYAIEYNDLPYGERLDSFLERVQNAKELVGANIKFDLNWIRRYGICFADKLIWDVLLVQFILNHQTTPFPSLNDVATQWGLGQKEDKIKAYWESGVDTPNIPVDELRSYLKQDVQLTKQIYLLQREEVQRRGLNPLMRLHNQDLLMLQEMEWRGIKYSVKASRQEAAKALWEIRGLKRKLNALSPIKPRCWSWQFLSNILYGGIYKYVEKEDYIFTYKDGSTKEKTRKVERQIELPRITTPPRSKAATEGYWPTDEATLKTLQAHGKAKKIINLLLQVREKEKFVGTYAKGFPLRIKKANWENELIHTNYNQVRAVTGRLSSDKPNVQNVPKEQKKFFISRYGE